MPTFSAESTIMGARIVDEFERTVASGITTYAAAVEMSALLNSGVRFPGRRELLAQYNRAKHNDRSSQPRVANGKTCNSPIKGTKPTVTVSSAPRGY